MKFTAAVFTGSSGMTAKTFYSLSNATNQVFLPLGLRFYKRPASEKHLLVYGKNIFLSRLSPRFLFSESVQLTPFTKASKKSGIRAKSKSSRELLLSEAATPKDVEAARQAIKSRPNVFKAVELLTTHLAPKQVLVNARQT